MSPNEIIYSNRLDWRYGSNRISQILKQKEHSGEKIIDLTESNPTKVRLDYPKNLILSSLSSSKSITYSPSAMGLDEPRLAVVKYYHDHAFKLEKEQILLTSSTSEAYSHILRLLADPNDNLLVPQPCYPLLHYLTALECIKIFPYELVYNNECWNIDLDSIRKAMTHSTRAIVIVNPNNPTGNFIKQTEMNAIADFCLKHNLPLIVDEVFLDYKFDKDTKTKSRKPLIYPPQLLTFILSGLSKVCGLPQMKLSWIAVQGPKSLQEQVIRRLALINDMYLSVSTPIQYATPSYLELRKIIHPLISHRLRENLTSLKGCLSGTSAKLLNIEGGWYGIIRLPSDKTDEDWVTQILKQCNVSIHPGYFYDFQEEAHLICSLLPAPDDFQKGIQRIKRVLK